MNGEGSMQNVVLSKQIKSMESIVVDLPWKSSEDHHLHCGVAMMRHMETYMGLQKWNSGLKKNNVRLTRNSVITIFIICFLWNENSALFRLKFVSRLLIYIHEAITYSKLYLHFFSLQDILLKNFV